MGRPRPPLLPFGSSGGLAHVTAAAVAELGNLSGDAGRGRVHSRGSQSEARVVEKEKKTRTALIEGSGENEMAKCGLRPGVEADKQFRRPLA